MDPLIFTMEPNGTHMNAEQINTLSIVYLALLTPSVAGSFSVLVVSIVRWRHLKQQALLLGQLALADLMAALILMSTSALNKVTSENRVNICLYSLPLSLTFYFISFLLVVVYAWQSTHAVQGWRQTQADNEDGQSQHRRKMIRVYVLVWLIPLVAYTVYVCTPFINYTVVFPDSERVTSSAILDYSAYCNSCILFLHFWTDPCSGIEQYHDIFIKYFLVCVVIPVIMASSVIYYKVGKWYERQEQKGLFPVEGDGRSRRRLKKVFSTARNMVMVILICWIPALVLILLSTLPGIQQVSLFPLYVIQAASVSLQGCLNSLVYAWRRPNFTEAVLGETTPLVAHGQPYFEESLRSSI